MERYREVQTGLGRTGEAFGYQRIGWQPDLVSVGKALGGGIPVGACLVAERVAETISPGDHGSTYGGNLLSCRAALVFLEALMEGGLQDQVRASGAHLERQLRALRLRHPVIEEVRGAGLMWGLQLAVDAAPVVLGALERGLLVNRTDERVVRLLPPLTITTAELDRAVEMLDAVLTATAAEATV
jgi:acetylornithine/succinyldiaminopimelate/putrescine aminotransferase